jgi:hypothetical protein
MKSMRILGLALAALIAVFAISAVSASAAPEWAACAKAATKGTGKYNDKLCSSENAEGKGAYELNVGSIGKGKGFKVKNEGVSLLHNVVPGTGDVAVECEKLKGAGNVVAPNAEKEVKLTFSKCTTLSKSVPCENEGGKKETIVTNALKGVLAEVEGKVGTILSPETGTYFVEFTCPGVFPKVRVLNQVFGEYTGNVNTISKTSNGHYTVGEYLGEPLPGYKPITNHPSAGPPSYGVLHTEAKNKETEEKYTSPENPEGWGPPGGLPSGQQGEVGQRQRRSADDPHLVSAQPKLRCSARVGPSGPTRRI